MNCIRLEFCDHFSHSLVAMVWSLFEECEIKLKHWAFEEYTYLLMLTIQFRIHDAP